MALFTIALGVLFTQLFPISQILYVSLGVALGAGWPTGLQTGLTWVIDHGLAFLAAWFCLRRLGVDEVASRLVAGRKQIKIALWLYAIYLLLALGGFLASAIPYGGGAVPRALFLLLVAVRALLFLGVAVALVHELPRLRRDENAAPHV